MIVFRFADEDFAGPARHAYGTNMGRWDRKITAAQKLALRYTCFHVPSPRDDPGIGRVPHVDEVCALTEQHLIYALADMEILLDTGFLWTLDIPRERLTIGHYQVLIRMGD